MFQAIKKTIKNSAIYGIGTISSKLIGFILLPLYTSYLSTSEYGVLAIVETTMLLLAAIVSLKINAAFFRWYWDKNFLSKQKSIFFTSVALLVFSSLIIILPLLFFNKEISLLLFETTKYSYLIVLMLVSTALQVIIQLVLYLIQLQEKPVFYSVSNIVKLIIALILTIVFITQLNRGADGIYEALVISQIVFLVITTKFIFTNMEAKFEIQIVSKMLRYSLPLIFAEISGILLISSDRYILNFMTSSSDVGIYSLAYRLANTIRVLIYSSVMMAVTPMIYQYIDKPNNKRFYSKILTYMAFGVMLFVLFFSIFSKEIIELVALNKDYWRGISLVPILTLAIFMGILKDVSLTGLNITKRTGIIAIVVILMSLLNIFLNILFIPYWGIEGAAIATLIVRVISFIVFYNFAQKYYKIPYEIKKVILVLFVGVFLIYISTLINNFELISRLFFKSSLILLFPFILYKFHFFEQIEIDSLKRGVRDFVVLLKRKK